MGMGDTDRSAEEKRETTLLVGYQREKREREAERKVNKKGAKEREREGNGREGGVMCCCGACSRISDPSGR